MRVNVDHPKAKGFIEFPEEWTTGDYDIYIRAYQAMETEGYGVPICRVAGVIALANQGVITVELEGLTVAADEISVKGITAQQQGVLIRAVALPLEATQAVPFGFSP